MADSWRNQVYTMFEGNWGEDPDDHLSRFERFCFLSGTGGSEQFVRRFQGSLASTAEEWYRNLPAEQRNEWAPLTTVFLARFRSPTFRLDCSEKLHSVRQLATECVSAYSDSVRKLARMLGITQESQRRKVKDIWIRCLRPEFFSAELNEPDKDFEASVQLAVEQEHRMGGASGPGSVQADMQRQIQELQCNLQRMQYGKTAEAPETGYKHYGAHPRAEAVSFLEEDEVVASVQAMPWPGQTQMTVGQLGPTPWPPQNQPAFQNQAWQQQGWQNGACKSRAGEQSRQRLFQMRGAGSPG